jgi:beta propeller repeat protein
MKSPGLECLLRVVAFSALALPAGFCVWPVVAETLVVNGGTAIPVELGTEPALDFSDGNVVYIKDVGYSRGADIFVYDLKGGKETRLTSIQSDKVFPRISGPLVVWADYRNADEINTRNGDIYLYDLDSSTETNLTNSILEETHPAISGSRIAFEQYYSQGTENGVEDLGSYIWVLDNGSLHRADLNDSYQEYAAISSNHVVWVDFRNQASSQGDLYLDNAAPIINNTRAAYPAIDGDNVVWLYGNDDGGTYALHAKNVSTGVETVISETVLRYQNAVQLNRPSISGRYVTWLDQKDRDIRQPSVYLYDLQTGKKTLVNSSYTGKYYPVVSGSTLVWGQRETSSGTVEWKIYYYDISGSGSAKQLPGGLKTDKNLNAAFSPSKRTCTAPCTLTFRAAAAKGKLTYYWDFDGDGIIDSNSKKGKYTYEAAGSYKVSLVLSSAKKRSRPKSVKVKVK